MGIPADIINAFTARLIIFPKDAEYFPPRGVLRFGMKFVCRPMVGLITSHVCTDLYSFQSRGMLDIVETAQVRVLLRIALEHTVSRVPDLFREAG